MKKLFIGTLMLAAISFSASAQTTKSAHGKTVSTVAKTTTPATTHGKTVSTVAKKDNQVVVTPKKTKVVKAKTNTNNRDKAKKVVAVKPKDKKD
jgi:hypothetical protein